MTESYEMFDVIDLVADEKELVIGRDDAKYLAINNSNLTDHETVIVDHYTGEVLKTYVGGLLVKD